MAFKFEEDESGQMSDINVVPLVDIMLVLLIIFMVTAPLSIGGIKVNLPTSKVRAGAMDEERVVLSINRRGKYFIEKLEIPSQRLEGKLKAIYEFRKKKNLYIRADRGVPYGKVVDAMSAAKLAGVSKMSMLTEAKTPRRRRGH